MSFAGHVLDMINRDNYNKSLRKAYRERYNKLKNAHLENIKLYSGYLVDKQVSEDELKRIRTRVRKSIIRERREAWLKSALLTIVVLLVLGWLVFGVIL